MNYQNIKIAIIDDNEAVLWCMTKTLQKMGCVVCTADSGESTFSLLEKFVPDIMFVDLKLGDIDGCEIASFVRLNSKYDSTILVALTGFSDGNTFSRIEKNGFLRYISKPFYMSAIEKTVAELCEEYLQKLN